MTTESTDSPGRRRPKAKAAPRARSAAGARYRSGTDSKPGLVAELAGEILQTHAFARDEGGRLYRFVNGVYRPDGAHEIQRRVKTILEARGKTKQWSTKVASETVAYLAVDAPQLWERPPLDTVNVQNGLLSLVSRQLLPHSPDFLSMTQLPVTYDPDASCPAWDEFAVQVFPPDAVELAFEQPARLMVPDTSHQKADLLLGEGANGKSTYLRALRRFLGSRNISGLSLHKLESDRFAAARLVGKLANVCPDLPSTHLENSSMFKQITGGDTVTAEYKFKDSFDFVPYARLVFSANQFPRSADASHAFFRRWRVVWFPRTFELAEQVPQEEFDTRLGAPAELSGVLNRCLAAWHRIREEGLLESDSMRATWAEFRGTTDPVAAWIDTGTVETSDGWVTKEDLLEAHNRAAEESGRPTLTATAFGRTFKRLRPSIREAQRTIKQKTRWVYLGLDLR